MHLQVYLNAIKPKNAFWAELLSVPSTTPADSSQMLF